MLRALRSVGMEPVADRSPLHLSGGQRRRVALASVLACDPEILVLDEPSANLEPVARRELAELLLSLGRTMLMVTHDLPFALQICPRSVLVDDGVVVADGPTREITSSTGGPFASSILVRGPDRTSATCRRDSMGRRSGSPSIRIRGCSPRRGIGARAARTTCAWRPAR